MSEKDKKGTPPSKSTAGAAKTAPANKTTSTSSNTAKSATAKPAARNAAASTGAKTAPAAKPGATPSSSRTSATGARPSATATSPKPAASTATRPAASTTAARTAAKAAPVSTATDRATKTAAVSSGNKNSGKAAKQTPVRTKNEGGAGTAVLDFVKSRNGIITIAVAAFVIILALVLGLSLGLGSCAGSNDIFVNRYSNKTLVGYSSEVIGTTERHKPVAEMSNGGLPAYPEYGKTLSSVIGADAEKVAARNALIAEASYLSATGTWNGGGGQYTWMDSEGRLYSGSVTAPVETVDKDGNHRQLYKHTASVGLYGGDVSDDEPGIIKRVTMRPRTYARGYGITGVYAPAGEVIKIQLSQEDMEATGGLKFHIGQALYNGKANNIWTAKNQMQRFPILLNTLTVNKNTATLENGVYTAYIGSFIGGPIYIVNNSHEYTVTISGGVRYSHFILGYTTPEEFEENAGSSAPYFDLEVWQDGVLHSGPKAGSAGLTYDDLYKAAILWEKVSLVTTQGSTQGIVFLYDPFVAAGAAVAFPGQGSVNCPMGWMRNSLNYKTIVKSGAWGNFHEYHHNFQGYGVGNGGEVTNNGMTLVSYALFTKISSARSISGYGAAGLGGWNRYTSATWALDQILESKYENGRQGLALYATLLHNFGPDAYIQSKLRQQYQKYGQTYSGYLRAWQDITHNDMTYFFKNLLGGITEEVAAQYRNPEYSTFVPVSSVYQTGRSYMYDGEKKYITTMQPYVIPYGQDFTVDLSRYNAPSGQYASGSVVLPDEFEYTVKESEIKQPEHGTLKAIGENMYTFTPDENMTSGKIIIPLEIKHKTDSSFKVDDVDLVLEFEQTHETKKTVLTRTNYTYDSDNMYTDAEEAFNANYANYKNKEEVDHKNPTQNCNTDIWYYPDTQDSHDKYPNAPDEFFVPQNTVAEVRGKLYIEEEGDYRIYLRGRMNCALYYSTDGGETYTLGAKINDTTLPSNSHLFRDNVYVDLMNLPERSWVYFKSVLIVQSSPMVSYIGLGMEKWTKPMFTMQEDDKGNTHYYNYLGIEVTEEEANNAQPIPPTLKTQPYVNAYRDTYEFQTDDFETDYFYTKKYTYSYADNVWQNKDQTLLKDGCKYSQGPSGWGGSGKGTAIENVADGDRNTWIHTSGGVSESSPLIIAMDMGEAKTVNRINLFSQHRPNGDWKVPTAFKLLGSLDGNEFFTVGDFSQVPHNGANITMDFEEATFRYYRLIITGSYSTHIIISEIELWKVFEINGGNLLSPDDETFTFKGNWSTESANATFGHVYTGKKNATVTFEFTGTRLAVLASKHFDRNIEVRIDGKKIESIALIPFENLTTDFGCTYISPVLDIGKHKVEIKCKGDANIDSFVFFG